MGFLWEFYGIFSSDSFRAKADEKIEKLHFINYTLKTEFTCHFRDKFGTLLKLFHSSIYLPATMPHHQTHTHNKKWKIISSCHCTTYDFTELFKSAYKRREREERKRGRRKQQKKTRHAIMLSKLFMTFIYWGKKCCKFISEISLSNDAPAFF